MKIFLYEDRATAAHRMHPVSKIVSLFLFVVLIVLFDRAEPLLALAVLVAGAAVGARALAVFRRLGGLLLVLFVVSTLLWMALPHGAGAGAEIPLQERLLRALPLGFRLVLMMSTVILFLATTRVEDFSAGLRGLGLPFRVAFALTLAFRLLPTFVASGYAVAEAQRARGHDLDHGGPLTRARAYVPLVAPMFLVALQKADRLSAALETRAFGCGATPTEWVVHRAGVADVLLVGTVVGLLLLTGLEPTWAGPLRAWLETLA